MIYDGIRWWPELNQITNKQLKEARKKNGQQLYKNMCHFQLVRVSSFANRNRFVRHSKSFSMMNNATVYHYMPHWKKKTTKNYVEINLSIHCKNSSFKFALNMSMVIHNSSAIVRSIVFTQKKKKMNNSIKKKNYERTGLCNESKAKMKTSRQCQTLGANISVWGKHTHSVFDEMNGGRYRQRNDECDIMSRSHVNKK